MKRLVLLCFFSCVTIGIVACSGTSTVAPSPTSTAKVTITPSSGASEASSPTTASSETTVTAVATSYYQAIVAQNYQLAFTYLDANATGPDGQRLTPQTFLQLAHAMNNEEGPVISFSVAAFQSMIVMTIYRKEMGPYHAHLQMKQENNGWKIISIDRI